MKNTLHWIVSGLSLAGIVILFYVHFYKVGETIAYIDTPRLVANYHGMVTAKNEYKKKAAVWSANIDTLQQEVNKLVQEYNTRKGKLPTKEEALQKELIKSKQEQLLQYREAIANKAQVEDQRMTQEVITEINAFIKAYGERNGYTVILGATQMGNLAYARESLDITDQLLKELNGTE